MILLDTHAFVWLACDDNSLGRVARRKIERAKTADGVAVSAVSFFELGVLVERGRIRMRESLEALRAQALQAGIQEVAIDTPIALLASRLRSFHGDPIDRLLVATAMDRGATLMTADSALLGWTSGPSLADARR